MSWRIDDHPEGGLQITHLDAPRFAARWTTGDFPIENVRDGALFWTDEGGAPEDSIHLWDFVWEDQMPGQLYFEPLMSLAAQRIECHLFDDW